MEVTAKSELFSQLPSVAEVLSAPGVAALVSSDGLVPVTDAVRVVLSRLRQEISSGLLDHSGLQLGLGGIDSAVSAQLRRTLSYSLRPVINATGVILHTNLGRAPLSEAALDHIRQIAGVYSNLEFEVDTGVRGKRDAHVQRLFERLLGASFSADDDLHSGSNDKASSALRVSTIVVNNNAAAVLLALNTLAEGGEAIVSRGELVEIGGSFRIPDVMAKSGATLREVGTTNRTRISDYQNAINERTRVLLRVNRSNFEITGFTEQASIAELAALAKQRGIPLIEDLGSGALVDLVNFGVGGEPAVLDSLRAGVDVVTYSGDKLLGGPQAGLISGRSDLISRMRTNSLFRVLRVDKLTYAALEATLMAYVKRDHDAIPALKMMRLSKDEIGSRADTLIRHLNASANARLTMEVVDGESVIGGGAAPSSTLPTRLLALSSDDLNADELMAKLRRANPPIVARVEDGRVLLDLRTVFPEQDQFIAAVLAGIAS